MSKKYNSLGKESKFTVQGQIKAQCTIDWCLLFVGHNGSTEFLYFFLLSLSDNELCHFTSKSISNEKDTFKSFITFNIIIRKCVFRVVVGNQFVVP